MGSIPVDEKTAAAGLVKKYKWFWAALLAAAALFLARGWIVRSTLAAGVRAVTGLGLQIRRLDISLLKGRVSAREVQLLNPRGFDEPVMADLPELTVEADLPAFLRGKTHLQQLTVDLRRFNVVKDADGRLNLDALASVQKAKEKKPAPKPKREFRIDRLHLKVGTVTYRDDSGGKPGPVREFPVNLDERHENITDPAALGALIVSRALLKTTVARLAQFDLAVLQDYAGTLQQAGEKALETVGGAVEGALDRFRKVIE